MEDFYVFTKPWGYPALRPGERLVRNKKGVFMLWIDVELAWGKVHRAKIDLQKVNQISIDVRRILDNLLGLLERYQIPVTWCIVGHLMLTSCKKNENNGKAHPDMPRPSFTWLKDDWYRYDPCTDIETHPAWYGQDVVSKIVKFASESRMSHDIGCHSFSHQLFGDRGCKAELARAEIKKCVELMELNYGITPTIFAFPREYVGHLNVLRELRFTAFRGVPTKLYPCLEMERTVSNLMKTYFSMFLQFLSYYLFFPPHVVIVENPILGLWSVRTCLAYNKKPLIPLRLVTFKAVQGINRAIREGKIFVMCMHLRDFSEERNLPSSFEKLLSHISKRREEGVLEVKTMSELVKESSGIV